MTQFEIYMIMQADSFKNMVQLIGLIGIIFSLILIITIHVLNKFWDAKTNISTYIALAVSVVVLIASSFLPSTKTLVVTNVADAIISNDTINHYINLYLKNQKKGKKK